MKIFEWTLRLHTWITPPKLIHSHLEEANKKIDNTITRPKEHPQTPPLKGKIKTLLM